MLPDQVKSMFGLKDQKDLKMATNIWKMLDQMAESNPDNYKQFIEKNVQEGMMDAKGKQQQLNKPYKLRPYVGFCLTMLGILNQRVLEVTNLPEKMLLTKQNWASVKKEFPGEVKIYLNVCHSQRVKQPTSKVLIQKYTVDNIRNFEVFYYSLQGPFQNNHSLYFSMILNSTLYSDLAANPHGKKTIMALSVSYLQERLINDKNILIKKYNPNQHRKLAYYAIEKTSIEINEKLYQCLGKNQPEQFLLERDIDMKRLTQQKKEQPKKKPEIVFRKEVEVQPQPKKEEKKTIQKKVVIELLEEKEFNGSDSSIPYELKETEKGYHIQFLLHGVASLQEVSLITSESVIKLSTKQGKQLQIMLRKHINTETLTAKFKKKTGVLSVDTLLK